MTHKKYSTGLILIALLFAVALALAVPASAQWNEKVLYSFQGGTNDGFVPAGGVVFDNQGNLYGTTTGGGPASCAPIGSECGTIFQLSPGAKGKWTETVIYRFQGEASQDGSVPNGGLIMDAAGNLYGVTAYGGTGDCFLLGVKAGCGTIYKMSPPKQKGGAWTETILYSFPTSRQGYLPNGDLVFDSAGNLYGATAFGGTKGTTCDSFFGGQCGVVFKLSPPKQKGGKWTEKVLHSFAGGADGANPNGGLVLDGKGNVYGTTYAGGNQGWGTAFRLNPPSLKGGAWTEKVLHVFKRDSSDGGNPAAGMCFDRLGTLYGTTFNGGPGQYGTVFSLEPPSERNGAWVETLLWGFNDDQQGAGPAASVVFDARGVLYGTTALATNTTAQGNVFRMKSPVERGGAWTFKLLYTFKGIKDGNSDGGYPAANVVFGTGGGIFSTTQEGGTGQSCLGGCGTVFEVSP